jgi:hypothetical protein
VECSAVVFDLFGLGFVLPLACSSAHAPLAIACSRRLRSFARAASSFRSSEFLAKAWKIANDKERFVWPV